MDDQEMAISQTDALESLGKIVWVIYWLGIASAILSVIPAVNMLSFILWVVALVLALVKRPNAKGTIYASHISNIITITVVGLIALVIVLLIFALIPIAGLAIGGIGAIIVFIWQIYRLVKGVLRMNDKKAFA
jgi:uncharacterized membrane protein